MLLLLLYTYLLLIYHFRSSSYVPNNRGLYICTIVNLYLDKSTNTAVGCTEIHTGSKLVIRLQMNFTKGYFQMTFFVKNSKYLSKCHTNLFPKSRFSKYINPWPVILFCEVQNQNKQKCASRYLYQNNNKRLHFLTQISPKSFLKISVY